MNNKTTKICLNAMVANEARTITRMLDSCYKYIDYWVIQDNGSTDGTQDIIRNFFAEKGIPGFLYETEWLYPGFNRDHALQTCLNADHGCDWILRMDADERLEVDEDFDWEVLNDTTVSSWNIIVHSFDTKYFRTWMWNSRLRWFFAHDRRHETIHLPDLGEDFQRITLPEGFRHIVTNDGQTWFAPRKFLKDALELESDKVVGNTLTEDMYHFWYVGKSYADCYGKPDELPLGKDHSDEYARRSLFYFKKWLDFNHNYSETGVPARIDEMAYLTFILMGDAYKFMGDLEKAESTYREAEPFAPTRNEHHLYLAILLESQNKIQEALTEVDLALKPERKNPFPNYCFLIENRAYHDSSSFLEEFKSKLIKRIEEPVISNQSVVFDFK
jgi:glycosyltransferase involved in cell wall biosynthesis